MPENVKRGVEKEEEEEEGRERGSDVDHFLPAKQDVNAAERRLCGFSRECAAGRHKDFLLLLASGAVASVEQKLQPGIVILALCFYL